MTTTDATTPTATKEELEAQLAAARERVAALTEAEDAAREALEAHDAHVRRAYALTARLEREEETRALRASDSGLRAGLPAPAPDQAAHSEMRATWQAAREEIHRLEEERRPLVAAWQRVAAERAAARLHELAVDQALLQGRWAASAATPAVDARTPAERLAELQRRTQRGFLAGVRDRLGA